MKWDLRKENWDDNYYLLERYYEENVDNYNIVLLNRVDHILEDLIFEGYNEINNNEDQKQVENILIKSCGDKKYIAFKFKSCIV